jgi:hypothetical protein
MTTFRITFPIYGGEPCNFSFLLYFFFTIYYIINIL